MREHRAAKRALRPVPTLPDEEVVAGAVELAVRAELAGMGDLSGWQGLAAGTIAMARILDHPGAVTTQPAALRQLAAVLETLHRSVAPRRGRLAVVQEMTDGRA